MICQELETIDRLFSSCRWACHTDAFEKALNLYSCSCETGCKLNPTGVGGLLFICMVVIYLTIWLIGKIKGKKK
jgi:hypothetical protein